MSADRQRLTSAIRRIAKTDPEIRGILDAADNKGGKPGAAGVGSSTDAESQRICCDGSVSDNANPGTETRDPNADGAGQDGGLDSTDPAKLDMGEGTLFGVTDCATGDPVCFDGSGFVPPDGWEDPKDPPIDPEYRDGVYYNETGVSGNYQLPEQAARARMNNSSACADGGCTLNDYYFEQGTTWRVSFSSSSGTDFLGYFSEKSCASSPQPICDEPPPTAESWPSDGCTNLAIVGGKIVGSKFDPENDGSWSAPRDELHLCDGADDIYLAPSATGGWKTINSTTNNGYLYDSSGRQIAHIDGNEYSDPSV